jgi:glycosyltransferase involved in cell wall biosynthesis
MRILIIENGYKDLVNSRFPLGDYFKTKGHSVVYSCPKSPVNSGVYNINVSRSKFSLFQLITALFKLIKIEKKEEIEAVLSFRLTSNILNYFSSFFKRKNRVAVITGLGYSFVYNNIKYKILKCIISFFYRLAERRLSIIAQNPDDLVDLGIKNGKVILGSGISENTFVNILDNNKRDSLNLLFVGRLLKSKGIERAINVFKEIQKSNKNVKLIIAGDIDKDNPDSVSAEYLLTVKEIKGVEYLCYVDNMQSVYSNCDILLFPSLYREGVPRVIIESLSYGLTVITMDMPGCRETINKNGILVKDDYVSEASSYIRSISKEDLNINKHESLKIFKEKFSRLIIFPKYLKEISSINKIN